MMNKNTLTALLLSAALAAPAAAIVVKDSAAPAADAVRQAVAAPAATSASAADDSHSLREGVVVEIGAKAERIKVNGSWLRVTPATKVFRQGMPMRATDLVKGQVVKFTLAGRAGNRDALGVVYVP